MGTIIGWVFKQLSPYLTPVIGVSFGILLIAVVSLGYLYKNQLEVNAVNETYITDLQGKIASLSVQIEDEKREQNKIVKEKDELNIQFRQAKRELLELKRNRDKVIANPAAEQKRVQESYDLYIDEIQCLTGDIVKCVNFTH